MIKDDSDSEEEILVYAEFEDSVNIDKYRAIHILGADDKNPIIQLDETFFMGKHENALGTYMFFEQDPTIQGKDPLFDKYPDKGVRYVCKTRKLLSMEHAYVTPKEGKEINAQNQVKQTEEGDVQPVMFQDIEQAREAFKVYFNIEPTHQQNSSELRKDTNEQNPNDNRTVSTNEQNSDNIRTESTEIQSDFVDIKQNLGSIKKDCTNSQNSSHRIVFTDELPMSDDIRTGSTDEQIRIGTDSNDKQNSDHIRTKFTNIHDLSIESINKQNPERTELVSREQIEGDVKKESTDKRSSNGNSSKQCKATAPTHKKDEDARRCTFGSHQKQH